MRIGAQAIVAGLKIPQVPARYKSPVTARRFKPVGSPPPPGPPLPRGSLPLRGGVPPPSGGYRRAFLVPVPLDFVPHRPQTAPRPVLRPVRTIPHAEYQVHSNCLQVRGGGMGGVGLWEFLDSPGSGSHNSGMPLYPINRSIPTNTDAAFLGWLDNFSTVLNAAPADFGIDAPTAGDVAAVLVTFSDAYDLAGVVNRVAVNPGGYTQPNRAALVAARNAALALVRPLAVTIQANDGVTDENKLLAGVQPRNFTRTPQYVPETAPVLSFLKAGIGTHTLGFADELTPSKKTVPYGAIGLQVWVGIGAVQTPLANLDFQAMHSRWPVVMEFDPADAGKLATYAARWVGRRGDVGPWSAIVTATVVFSEVPA